MPAEALFESWSTARKRPLRAENENKQGGVEIFEMNLFTVSLKRGSISTIRKPSAVPRGIVFHLVHHDVDRR